MRHRSILPYIEWVFIGMVIGCFVVSFWAELRFSRIKVSGMNKWHSSAYRATPDEDMLLPPRSDEVAVFQDSVTEISVAVPEGFQSVELSFFYQCEPRCEQLWIELTESTHTLGMLRLLVEHPIMEELNWFYVDEGPDLLYQRTFMFSDIVDFVNFLRFSPGETVLIDSQIAQAYQLQGENIHFLEESWELGEADYVFTRWSPPGVTSNGWRYFRRKVGLPKFPGGTMQVRFITFTSGSEVSETRVGKLKLIPLSS